MYVFLGYGNCIYMQLNIQIWSQVPLKRAVCHLTGFGFIAQDTEAERERGEIIRTNVF